MSVRVVVVACRIALLLSLAIPATGVHADDEAGAKWAAQIDHWVPPLMRAAGVPGLSLAVVHEGRIVVERSYGVGDRERGSRLSPELALEAASLSKPVFAYAVLKLVEDGRLDLDASLTDYLDEPYIDDDRLPKVTARVVLSHTTGFPNWRPRRWTDDPAPLELEADPGERWGYSGEGYVYLQRVVEEITGSPAADYLRSQVLEPLGMNDSSFVWETRFVSQHVSGHDEEGNPETPRWQPDEAVVAGSLETTAGDYARFLLAMLGGEVPDPHGLEPATLDAVFDPQVSVDEDLAWGLGWGLEHSADGTCFWHWGDNGEFKAFAIGDRARGTALVVLTNSVFGFQVIRPIVELVLPGRHPSLDFRMVHYDYPIQPAETD
jgi:CubicO group peptidase (beta-lactamase class C family)